MRRTTAVLLLGLLGSVTSVSAQDPTFDAKGFQKGRDTFSQLPFEHVDALTGNLILTFTDFVLPGNAGFDVRFQRTYNSKSGQWTFGLAGVPLSVSPALPTVLPNPDPLGSGSGIAMPMLKTADGAEHQTVWQNTSNTGHELWTEDFWQYDVVAHEVELPNGLVVEFGYGTDLLRTISEIRDPFGNRVTFSEDGQQIVQHLGNGQTRTIDITTEVNGDEVVQRVTYLGRHWTYKSLIPSGTGVRQLFLAEPPAGAPWTYGYTGLDLTSLTTPNGGTITYEWGAHGFYRDRSPAVVVQSHVITSRTLGGRDMPAGTWTYVYDDVDNQMDIIGPVNTIGYLSARTASGRWQTARRTVTANGHLLETETWNQQTEQILLADRVEPEYHVPLLSEHKITRFDPDGTPHVYRTTYEYDPAAPGGLKDFGRPRTVTEQGERTRVTTFAYDYDFGPFIRQRVKDETVVVNGETFTSHYDWDHDTGFLEGETIHGIHADYAPDSFGNRATATDAHGHVTRYSHRWGAPKDTQTPKGFWITREINDDGTVASESRNGATTTFTYDHLGRLKSTTPPGRAAVLIDYATDRLTTNRGTQPPSPVTTIWLDGFGRKRGTDTPMGVHTRMEYDAEGRKTKESVPFGATAKYTTFEYDGLDRLKKVIRPDGKSVSYDYDGGIDVAITDEENRVTRQNWSAFGDPSGGLLISVQDADQNTFAYEYNGMGRLTRVDSPEGPSRTWTYWPGQDLLKSETQPESGTVDYFYDTAGRLSNKEDRATGVTFGHGYDANDRLTSITMNAGGGVYDVTMDYDDADNRTLLRNATVESTFAYSHDNLIKERKDTIAGQGPVLHTKYSYDSLGNLEAIEYPSGQGIGYDYDEDNRAKRATRGSVALAQVNSFHPSGAIQQLEYNNGIVENFEIDDARLWTAHISGGPLDLTYDYYANGNVKSITDPRPGFSQTLFEYDNVDRLTGVTGFGQRSYTYDTLGNRKTQTTPAGTTNYSYDPATNRLESVSGPIENDIPIYRPNGNLETSLGFTFTYTPFNLVETATRQVNGAPRTERYRYDGDGIRIIKEPAGSPIEVSNHGLTGQLLSEFTRLSSTELEWKKDYVYLGSRLVASLAAPAPTASIAFAPSASATVVETGGTITATVTVTTSDDQPLRQALTAQFATVAGTAVAGADFNAKTNTLTFEAGVASGSTRTITVGIVDDTDYEEDEQFTIALSSASGGTITGGLFTVTITDNDPHPVFSLDAPLAGSTVFTPLAVGGWIIDSRAAEGTGVDAVTLRARTSGGIEIDLGAPPAYGGARPDVAAVYGAQFQASGFSSVLQSLGPGEWDLILSAHFVADGITRMMPPRRFTVETSEKLSLDTPTDGQTLGQQFIVGGWAIDREAPSGTGVDQVTVRAFPAGGAPAIPLGTMTAFSNRQDVGDAFGARFAPSGFTFLVSSLGPGAYRIEIDARSTVSGSFTKSVNVMVASNTLIGVDAPVEGQALGQSFLVGGWAIDTAAAAGTGVDQVEVLAYQGTTLAGRWVATYGGARADIGAVYGARFQPSGFNVILNTLLAGAYRLEIQARSTFTHQVQTRSVNITVVSDPRMSVDVPAGTPTIWADAPFQIGGWAVDLRAATAPGVNGVDVWALPTGSTPGPPRFLGPAVFNIDRPDVASALNRPDLVHCGYGMIAPGLPVGTYAIRVSARSSVTNTFNNERQINVIVATPGVAAITAPVEGRVGGQAITVTGWAIDRAAASGTGVSFVNVKAIRTSDGTVIALGPATYGLASSEGGAYGAQFALSGFSLTTTSLAAGTYSIEARPRSAVTGLNLPTVARTVTITSSPVTQVDAPGPGQVVVLPMTVAGWAIDASAAASTGVDSVDVYAQPSAGGTETYLGRASYAIDRPDIGAVYGAQFRPSGFALTTTLPGVGSWVVKVKSHSMLSQNTETKTITVTAQANPVLSLEAPANGLVTGQPFLVGGWGIDLASVSGTGADSVRVVAYPASGGTPIVLGTSYGGARNDVAVAFGERFRNSGFTMNVSGLTPGTYTIEASLHSTVTNTYNLAKTATITIPTPNVLVAIDTPAPNQTVGQPFVVAGWAIDLAHPTESGVSALHVYAYPAGGGPPVWVGAAVPSFNRLDVGNAFGSRFTPSGWGLTVSGLAPGWYTLVAYPFSTVTQDFRHEAALARVVYVAY